MADLPNGPEGRDGDWPPGWRIELDIVDGAERAGWQANLWFRGERICRLCAFNSAKDAAAAREHAYRRIGQWLAEWQARMEPPR